MYVRPFIDSLDFAANGKQIDAQVPFAELPRLLDVLENPQGILHYILQGRIDNQGRPVLDVSLDGNCQLRCQRCLHGLDYAIQHEARLLLCDQASLDVLEPQNLLVGHPDDDEEYESILADAHLDVLALLEDEILLALPISPMHELGACQVAEEENKQEGEPHPFAVLEKLKRK